MILQVLADTGQFVPDLDAMLLQQRGWTNARQLQKLRRADRSRRQDELARNIELGRHAFHLELEPGGALAGNDDALGLGVAQYGEIATMLHRLEEGAHRIEAQPGFLVHLEI